MAAMIETLGNGQPGVSANFGPRRQATSSLHNMQTDTSRRRRRTSQSGRRRRPRRAGKSVTAGVVSGLLLVVGPSCKQATNAFLIPQPLLSRFHRLEHCPTTVAIPARRATRIPDDVAEIAAAPDWDGLPETTDILAADLTTTVLLPTNGVNEQMTDQSDADSDSDSDSNHAHANHWITHAEHTSASAHIGDESLLNTESDSSTVTSDADADAAVEEESLILSADEHGDLHLSDDDHQVTNHVHLPLSERKIWQGATWREARGLPNTHIPEKLFNAALLALSFGFALYTVINVDSEITRGWTQPEIAMRIPLDTWSSYEASLSSKPVETKTLINVVIYLLGDWLSQTVFQKKDILDFDAARTLRNGFIGLCFGPLVHEYYEFSDSILPVDVGINRLYKILMDQTIYIFVKCSVYIVAVGTLSGQTLEDSVNNAKERILGIMFTAWKFWPLVHCVTYSVIPAQHRILWVNSVDLIWNAILATKASGAEEEVAGEEETLDAPDFDELNGSTRSNAEQHGPAMLAAEATKVTMETKENEDSECFSGAKQRLTLLEQYRRLEV